MPIEITKGSVKRNIKEIDNKITKEQEKINKKSQQLLEQQNKEKLGKYKKLVIDNFLEIFSSNYGDGFDYNSLINAIKFKNGKDNKGNALFEFSFSESNVIFKSDAKKQCKEFNENSYSDFISNEDVIQGNKVSRYYFNNSEEYEAYENNDIDIDDSEYYDGIFIPISDAKDRYGEFNRINKLAGYTPINVSKANAENVIKTKWNKLTK